MATAAIAASSSGDNTVVPAVAGKRIRVIAGHLSFSGNVNAKWKSGASTDLTGLYYGAAATQVPLAATPEGVGGMRFHFETAQGEALVLNLSGATAVGGHVAYEVV